jgi:hypothetical protein
LSMKWADTEPFLGAKYHTVHHTHYHYNFGQVCKRATDSFGTVATLLPHKNNFSTFHPFKSPTVFHFL